MNEFQKLLEQLAVPCGEVLFVHASAQWAQRGGFEARDILSGLQEWAGPSGTVVMPSFPFVGAHLDYMRSKPAFDVRHTPAKIGLIYEVFRRSADVTRSAAPDLPVAARGKLAMAITSPEPSFNELDPAGKDTVFARILSSHPTLVGLGVSLNTNVLIHHLDSLLQDRYPGPLYGDEINDAAVIDADGASHIVRRKSFLPELQAKIRPSAVRDLIGASPQLSVIERNGATFFRWDLDAWSSTCTAHVTSLRPGTWPCWLREFSA